METTITISIRPKVDNLYRVLTDRDVNRTSRIGLPMVWVFVEKAMPITREWQWFIRAINPGMEARRVSALLNTGKAFANGEGFEDDSDPRQNWILGQNLDPSIPLPKLDKVRTCGNARVEMIGGVCTFLDGNSPPPLKPGVLQPQTMTECTLEKYLYTPQTHPHLFFECVSTGSDLDPNPFPYGAVYPWHGSTPVTFMPHVSPVLVVYPPAQAIDNSPTLEPLDTI